LTDNDLRHDPNARPFAAAGAFGGIPVSEGNVRVLAELKRHVEAQPKQRDFNP
jgi:hypothetical protein